MLVKKIMKKQPKTLSEDEGLDKAIRELCSIPESALPVVNKKGKVVGELSQENLLLRVVGMDEVRGEGIGFEDLHYMITSKAEKVRGVMKRHEITASPDDDARTLVRLMYDNHISTVPVLEKGKLVGIVTDIGILKQYKKVLQ